MASAYAMSDHSDRTDTNAVVKGMAPVRQSRLRVMGKSISDDRLTRCRNCSFALVQHADAVHARRASRTSGDAACFSDALPGCVAHGTPQAQRALSHRHAPGRQRPRREAPGSSDAPDYVAIRRSAEREACFRPLRWSPSRREDPKPTVHNRAQGQPADCDGCRADT